MTIFFFLILLLYSRTNLIIYSLFAQFAMLVLPAFALSIYSVHLFLHIRSPRFYQCSSRHLSSGCDLCSRLGSSNTQCFTC